MEIKRIHNSNFYDLKPRKYIQHNSRIPSKPDGLWYGINDSWFIYCKEYFPEWIHEYSYELIIDERQLLIIDNLDLLYKFSLKYHIKPGEIDWVEVSKKYAGIEVRNYDKLVSEEVPQWFTHWELDSGCIWDWNYINKFQKLESLSL